MAKKFGPKDLGIQSAPAGFNIPKIKKVGGTAVLNYLAPSDRRSQEVIREVERTCLDPDLKIRKQWKLSTVHTINPASIVETRYREKRAEMKEQGGARVQQEVFGFYICRDRTLASDIAKSGIKANPYVKGCLGDPSHGVYLFRYLDVALVSQRECRNACIMVFKVLQGRAKQIPATEMSSRTMPKEPTPNFDCHLSQSAPRHDEAMFTMCSKSQMYVYEYTEDAVPAEFPRQCLPYALLEFSNCSYAKADSSAGAGDPKGVSTPAANAGWASAGSTRRLSAEVGRKVGPENFGQYSKEQPAFTFPAGQPVAPPVPSLIPCDSALRSPRGGEPVPSVVQSPDSGTWRAPLEYRDGIYQPAPLEMSSTSWSSAETIHRQQTVTDGLAVSSDCLGQVSMATSATVSRDPRFQRLLGNDRPKNPPGGNTVSSSLTAGVPVGEQQANVVTQNVKLGQRPWDQRGYDSNLLPGQSSESVMGSLNENQHHEGEGNLTINKLPHVPSLGRTPAKSALKKPTVAWPSSSQADGNKKKLSFQDYLKKKKAEAQGNAGGKGTTVQTATLSTSGDKTETVKVANEGVSEESPRKQVSSFWKDEFQGCIYYPPQMHEQNEKASDSAGINSVNPAVGNKQSSQVDQTNSNSKSSESTVSCPRPNSWPVKLKPGRRDPRLHSSSMSSVYSGKIVTKEPNEDDDSNSSSVSSGKMATKEPNEDDDSNSSSVTSWKVTTKEPNEEDDRLSRPDGALFQGRTVEDKSESVAESPQKLPSELQAKSDDVQNKTVVPLEEKVTDKQCVQQNSESSLMDTANHQVLFADLEETEHENALSMWLGDISPTEHPSERGEDRTVLTFETRKTVSEEMSTTVIKPAAKHHVCAPGEDKEQDMDDEMTREHESVAGVSGSGPINYKEGINNDNSKAKSSKLVISEKTSSAVSQIVSVLKQGLRSSMEPAKTTDPSEGLQESVTVKQKISDDNLPSPSEPLLEQRTCENTDSTDHLVHNIAKGLKVKLALTAVEGCKKGKSVPKYQYVVKQPESMAESPSPDSSSSKSGNVVSNSESDLSLPASESSISSKGKVSKSSSDNSTLHCVQTEKTTKSPNGKGQKSESRRKGKPAEAEVAEPDVDYALLRLAKGLRPGKSIHVSGLGKNPTDDPLPVLEGKRRKKKAPETKQSGQRDTQVRDTQVRTIKKQPKSQTAGKKTRKKRKSTLSAGKKKSKKKPAAEVHASPPMDEDIDYTDFQFEEPQEFCMSISDGMEAVNSTPDYPAADIAVKIEPPEEPTVSVWGSGPHPAVKTEPGIQASSPSSWGGAHPLSSLGLLHWTEALLQPSLNPQVALVDLFMACRGLADFDNCRICQKVIDPKMLEEEDPTADETMATTAEGTAGCDASKTSNAVHEVFSVKSEEVGSESLERNEMKSAADVLADKTTAKLTKVTSDSREVNRNESQEQKFSPMNILSSPLKRSIVANESVTETKKEVESDHSCSPETEEKTQVVSSSGPVLREKELSSSSSVQDCSDTEMSAPTVGPLPSPLPKESTSSLSKAFSGPSKQLPDTQKQSAVLKEKVGLKTSESIQSSTKSQVSFGVPAQRFPSPRPAFSVCSQGSAKQKWQHWKNSQAQQIRQKTSGETDDLQKQLSVSGDHVDKGRDLAEPVVADTDSKPDSQDSAVTDSLEKDTHTGHMVSAKSTADSNVQESEQGNSEVLDETCTKSSEKSIYSESNSCVSEQSRQNESWIELGYWLSIEQLASLDRSQKDATEVTDTAEIYSRCVSKISPTKLSKLVPGKEEKRTPPTYPMKATESGNALPLSCVVSDGKPEQVSKKVQDNIPACVEETFSSSTKVTANSDILPSDDAENKNSESCIISKHKDERKPSDNSQQTGVNNKDVLFPDSVQKTAQEIREISPALCREPAETERTEKHGESVRQNTAKNRHPRSSHAERTHEENKVDPLPCPQEQTETSSPLTQMSGVSEQSKSLSAVQRMGEEIDSESKQLETVSPVSAEKNTDFFDIVIKNSCSVTKQPHSCIPGLDLVTSQKAEIDTSTRVTTAHPDSVMTGVKVTPENADVFSGENQQSRDVDEVKNGTHESRGGANEECAKDGKDGEDCSIGALQSEELNSTVSPNTDLSKELDVVGTLGTSHQTRRKGEIKMRTFSIVSPSLNRKNKDVSKINEQHSDSENTNSDDRQSLENDGVAKTDGNTFDTDVDSDSKGQMSGCPIPSLTRTRAKQKSDRRENKKQSDVLKECGMENLRSLSSESTRPSFQTAASEQPPPPGLETSSDPKVTSSSPFYPNPPHSPFHAELTYQPPMHPLPMPVNTVYVPRVPMSMPNVPVFNVPGQATTDPVSVYNSPVVNSESGRSLSSDRGRHIPVVLPMVPPPMFIVPPPPLARVPAISMRLPPPGTEVSSPLATAHQVISASTNLVCVTAADTSALSVISSTSSPTMTQDTVEGSRGDSVKSKIDVISWFAKREAAERNPPKKDMIDWFSDIIDKKKNVSSDSALEPEVKKAKLEFIESLKNKKSMYDSKEKGSECSRMSPCESGDAGKDAFSKTSSKSPCEPGDRRKNPASVNSRKSPCESADTREKSSVSLKRQNGSGSSGEPSSSKKHKLDISKVSFKIGLTSEGINKKRGPLIKNIDLDSHSDSDDFPKSPKDDHQQVIDEKSRSDAKKTKKVSTKDHGKSDTNNRKGSKERDIDQNGVESCTHVGKDQTGAHTTKSDTSKPVANSSNSKKRWHTRWDKTDCESNSKKFCAQQSDTNGQPNDTDDDMNDYAHALLEGGLGVKNLGPVSNRISDSILKSVSSAPKPPEACDKPSIQPNTSTELEKQPGSQKESKSAKTNSNLTDKPLEFLLFAKEMIMQKLQEEEEVEEGEIKDDPVDNATHFSQNDPVDSPKTGLLSESDDNPSEQTTSKRFPSDSQCVLSKERKENKEDQPKKELASATQSKAVLQTVGSPVYGMTAEDISMKKDTAGQSCSDWLQGSSERMVTSASVSQKTSPAECSLTSYTLDASSMAAVTEDEINKLKDIVCQLTSLPVKTASDKPSTSAEKDKSTHTVGGSEQKPKPSSSQAKDSQEDKPVIERSKPRGGSAGRDWSLFLTTARPSLRRLCAGASERRNYYGDIIESPLYASNQESLQEPTVYSSTRESYPGSHARSHLVSKPHAQAAATSSSGLPLPGIGSAPESDYFHRFSSMAQKETGENPQTGVTKGDNSVPMKSLQAHSADRQKQYYKVWHDSALETDVTETRKHAAPPVPSDPTTQMITEPNAAKQHTSTGGKPSSVQTVQSSASSASSALDSDRKTLKDFLLENFPGEDLNSYVHLLDYKLTADVNAMTNKTTKNILCRVSQHLQHLRTVSHSTSVTPITRSPAAPKVLLEEFAVDQIELELRLIEGCLRLMEATRAIQSIPDQDEGGSDVHCLTNYLARDSDVAVKDALTVVVNDFNNAMTDTNRRWRGRPHQQIPTELLLRDEKDQLYTKEGAFMILVSSIPNKPFARLLEFKEEIEECLMKIGKAAFTNQTFVLQQEKLRIKQTRAMRLQLLRTFTGSVSQVRLRKVTMSRDHYATSQRHLLQVLGDGSVAKMVFFRAVYEAIENHLQILETLMK